jgi:lanthanide-dependent methanol dehydrogenase
MTERYSGFIFTAAFVAILAVSTGSTLANEELLKLQSDSNQWVMQTGNYANWRYSELA